MLPAASDISWLSLAIENRIISLRTGEGEEQEGTTGRRLASKGKIAQELLGIVRCSMVKPGLGDSAVPSV